MDKNIGEQLNKAYEAFRQACMDRDSAVKELQQKVCGFSWKLLFILVNGIWIFCNGKNIVRTKERTWRTKTQGYINR